MADRLFSIARRGRRRLLCAALVFLLLLGVFPMGALAADSSGGYNVAPASDSGLPKAGDSPWLAWALAIAAFTFGGYMQGKGNRAQKRKDEPKV